MEMSRSLAFRVHSLASTVFSIGQWTSPPPALGSTCGSQHLATVDTNFYFYLILSISEARKESCLCWFSATREDHGPKPIHKHLQVTDQGSHCRQSMETMQTLNCCLS